MKCAFTKPIVVLFFALNAVACTKQLKPGNYLINSPIVPDEDSAKTLIGRQAINEKRVSWFSKPTGGIPVNILVQNDAYDTPVSSVNYQGNMTIQKLSNTDVAVSANADLTAKSVKFLEDASIGIKPQDISKIDYKITKVHKVVQLQYPKKIDNMCNDDVSRALVTYVYLVDAEATYTTEKKLDASATAKLSSLSSSEFSITAKGDNKIVLNFTKSWAAITVEERHCG